MNVCFLCVYVCLCVCSNFHKIQILNVNYLSGIPPSNILVILLNQVVYLHFFYIFRDEIADIIEKVFFLNLLSIYLFINNNLQIYKSYN